MAVTSAGILLYRLVEDGAVEVFIAHMGGPFWASKDDGAWSIPKGEFVEGDEAALDAARREFAEELGVDAPDIQYAELGTFAYSSGKRVTVFVADGAAFEHTHFEYGEFELEWPPRSGKVKRFPEMERAEWFALDHARQMILPSQAPLLGALEAALDDPGQG